MTDAHSQASVGIVEPKSAFFDEPLFLRSGEVLEEYTLVYETYGQLNPDGSNAVLIAMRCRATIMRPAITARAMQSQVGGTP